MNQLKGGKNNSPSKTSYSSTNGRLFVPPTPIAEGKVRGLYHYSDEDEDEEWKRNTASFDSHTPKFATKKECIDFSLQNCRKGSNPDYPNFQQIFTQEKLCRRKSCQSVMSATRPASEVRRDPMGKTPEG